MNSTSWGETELGVGAVVLNLIFELDLTTVGCTRDILRQCDFLDRLSEIPWVVPTFIVIEVRAVSNNAQDSSTVEIIKISLRSISFAVLLVGKELSKESCIVIPQTTTISNIKLPILKKEEYDIWAMEMEHYLEYIDNDVWKVIQNGNSKKRISTGKDGIVRILSPVTAAEIQAVEKERKAKNILLMAIPKEHMRRFHGMDDAKEIWEAIRTRFGGNANSKKMQKAVFKQQFEAFKISSSEGLEKGYDRFQQLLSQLEAHGAEVSTEDANHKFLRSLPPAWSNLAMTMRTKPEVDTLSIDDLYNNLRVFEQEIQGASKTSSSAQNVAFVSQSKSSTNKVKSGFTGAYSTCTPSTSSTNIPEKEVLAGFADEVIYSLFAKQSEDWDLLHEDLEQIDDLDIEEMDINWQIAMIAIRMKKFYKKTGRRVRVDGKTPVGFDKKKLECFNCHNTGHFARECTAKGTHDGKKKRDSFYQHQEAGKQEKNQMGLLTMDDGIVNWGEHTEVEETNHALMAISSRSIGTSSEHSVDPESEISRVPPEVYVFTPITTNETAKIKKHLQFLTEEWNAMNERELNGKSLDSQYLPGHQAALVLKDRREIGALLLRPQQVIIGGPLNQTLIVTVTNFNRTGEMLKGTEKTGNNDQWRDFEEYNGESVTLGRFSWVFFLASKDETSGILQNFIRQIENQLSHRVKIIRSDNGTEFKNRDMLEFCGNKGIKQEYSNARTPQQNGVILLVCLQVRWKNLMRILNDETNFKGVRLLDDVLIDYLTDSMNYIPVSLENQANPHAGASEVTNSTGTSQTPNSNASEEKDKDVELIVVPSAVKTTKEKVESMTSSTNSKKQEILTEPQQEKKASSTDTSEDNPKIQAFRRELEEIALKHLGTVSKNNSTSTPSVNTGSEPVNTGRFDPDDSPMPELEIFHNLPTEIEVSPTPTLRIHNIHPKSQILGDPKSSMQTRSKVQQKSRAHALFSNIQKQQRNNHKDQQHCLFAYFLSQEEPKKISEALQDDSWVQAMQEELLQFKLQHYGFIL
ncbi:ribonuclease H-like domain-containing protein [Tanacetum coccineum]|uniref:Ribonuclease H-like domain-containing protein n=1 Tax=Tanacetum coccineum TaxID=301880 RepID=A0ABQ5HVQ5_9ASTR